MTGNIHSIETCGTLDGPGIRYVIFMQGCPLRCKYCHNPDTWAFNGGKQFTPNEVVEDILKYRSFIKRGGVTFSGGEPLLQAEFVLEVLKQCKKYGIHTAIDTSGCVPLSVCAGTLDYVDLVLLDIKHIDTNVCKILTGMGNENTIRMLEYLEEKKKDVWIRHVIVPGFTEDYKALENMAEFLSHYTVISKIELLPFHKMGEYKWKSLGFDYELLHTSEPTKESIIKVKDIFKKYKFNVI
ncbi:MAG TPA: pyruvate formate-lyase-activating protein [Pseudobacteroides sp.]|uniref:pyruvate formate-lyase-activating protein n=1 Tax=Pseudobacteroides sp. TaxID=1968840 RepID=UPI002F95ED4E